MSDCNQKAQDASARFNKTVKETTDRVEKEAAEFVKYLNDQVVPNVRLQSTKALRVAAEKLQQLASYMEQHPGSSNPNPSNPPSTPGPNAGSSK